MNDKALEALLDEEKDALETPVDNQSESSLFAHLLPYAKHEPFFSYICGLGFTAIMASRLHLDPDYLQIVQGHKNRVDFNEDCMWARIVEIEKKHRVAITDRGVNEYLVGLAGRILEQAKKNLPELDLENIASAQKSLFRRIVAEKLQEAKKMDPDVELDAIRGLVEIKDPHMVVLGRLESVQTFYREASRFV